MKLLKKMMSFSIMLSLCMIVGLCSNIVVANAAQTADGLVYEVDKGVVVITGYVGTKESLVIPDKIGGYEVYEIADDAFAENEVVKSVTIPKTVGKIGVTVFAGCTELTTVKILGPIESLPYATFGWCYKLTTVELPNSLISIDDGAFSECYKLVNIKLPNSVKTIGWYVFQNCESLKTINIPKNVEEFDAGFDGVFEGCKSLTAINVDSNNKKYASVDGVLFNKAMTELIYCPAGKTGEYTVPKGVEIIGWAAFDKSHLTKVVISEGVKELCYMSFTDTSIEKIVMPASLEEISEVAFNEEDRVLMYCKKNSVAHQFAKERGYRIDLEHHVANMSVTISQPSFGYTGEYIKPVVTVKGTVGGKTVTLTNWTDYKIEYKNFKNPGTATITVIGRGNYVGETSITFTIRPIDISKFSATIKQNSFAYTGEYIKPVVTVKGTALGKEVTLENWTDYKIEYKNFKNPGQATMTITGRGIYGGTKTITFYIRPGQVKNVKYVGRSTAFTNFKWDECVGVTGYEVYRATSQNGTYTKVGTVTATSFKNTGLKSGTTYYYKVRAYKTVGSTKLYGAYSSVYTLATSK